MLLSKSAEIYVYKLDNDGTFDAIGEINKFTSLIWPDKFNGLATFELNAPITPENKELIKKQNILWCGGDNACVIEIIQSDTNENGQKTYKVKGRTLEVLLKSRIVWGTYNCFNVNSSTAMYEIVNKNCVNPVIENRKIPFLECDVDEKFGKIVSFQKTGGEVYDALQSIASDADIGFDILFKPREKKLVFKVTKGTDRSVMSSQDNVSNIVIFSTDLEDILSSSYYTNDQDVKTTAYVAGEDEGANRKHVVAGNENSKGFLRKELYVDARDLRSEVYNDDGTTTTITDDEYNSLLYDRGDVKLSECIETESFEAKMRVIGDIQYVYGVDYFKGDKVIVQDVELGVQVIAKVTEVSENYDDEYELVITFGYSYPTLIQKVKWQID